jgi:hypothetical protein
MGFTFQDVGACNCPGSGVTLCGCTNVPTPLTATTGKYGTQTLTYNATLGHWVSPTFSQMLGGCADGVCAAATVDCFFTFGVGGTCELLLNYTTVGGANVCPGSSTSIQAFGYSSGSGTTIACSPFLVSGLVLLSSDASSITCAPATPTIFDTATVSA